MNNNRSKLITIISLIIMLKALPAFADETIDVSTRDYAYLIHEQDNPSLTLVRGETYHFKVNAPGHPFLIKTKQSAGLNDLYEKGITGNGLDKGMIVFSVPMDAPDKLAYNCQFHVVMSATINIVNKQ